MSWGMLKPLWQEGNHAGDLIEIACKIGWNWSPLSAFFSELYKAYLSSTFAHQTYRELWTLNLFIYWYFEKRFMTLDHLVNSSHCFWQPVFHSVSSKRHFINCLMYGSALTVQRWESQGIWFDLAIFWWKIIAFCSFRPSIYGDW